MATRAHFVKKARKDNPVAKKGQSYWWWQFAFGRKQYSLTQPKPQQLTQSEYEIAIMDFEEELAVFSGWSGAEWDADSLTEFKDRVSEYMNEIQGRKDNMPDGLQEGPTGELLQERIDSLEQFVSALDEAIDSIQEKYEEFEQEVSDKLQNISF